MHSHRVLIAGVSTRAAAESAARAGFDVTAIDGFADLDQHPAVRTLPPLAPFAALAAARATRDIACDAVVYLSPFENHRRAVAAMTEGRTLWGNPPEVLTRVRDPIVVANALRSRGFETPQVRLKPDATTGEEQAPLSYGEEQAPLSYGEEQVQISYVASGFSRTSADATSGRWLVKPLKSGGGHGVRFWCEGDDVPRGHYLQQFVEGTPGSVVFVAAGGRAVPLGVLRQLIGEAAFGATGFRYCGNILTAAGDPQFAHDAVLVDAASELSRAVAEQFGVVGVNGIDFVARDDAHLCPVEINPRWCASLELVERGYGLSVFGIHAAACDTGTLPDFDLVQARRAFRGAIGKAVVFARQDVVVGDTRTWLDDDYARGWVRDIPRPGERIAAGLPVCTIFAAGLNARACHDALVERAAGVYAQLAGWGTEVRML